MAFALRGQSETKKIQRDDALEVEDGEEHSERAKHERHYQASRSARARGSTSRDRPDGGCARSVTG